MALSTQEWWHEVNEQAKELGVTVMAQAQQPHDVQYNHRNGLVVGGTCYIMSEKNRQQNITAGKVSLAPIKLAAQRMVEGGFRLATDEEILAYKAEEASRREDIARAEKTKRHQFVS